MGKISFKNSHRVNFPKKIPLFLVIFLFCFCPLTFVRAQESFQEDIQGIAQAKVIEVLEEGEEFIPGTDVKAVYQILEAEILKGEMEGNIVTVENDRLQLEKGDKFFLNYLITADGEEFYSVQEPDRRGAIYFFICLFVVVILIFGGFQGLRSLLSLAASFFVIIYLLVPKILSGASPIVASIVFSALILVLVIYLTHGINRKSTSALMGTIITIIFTGVLAYFAVKMSQLTGFASDEAVYLNFATGGQLDFRGLLLGAIIIGTIGILDDIAITQASAVRELHHAASHLSKKEIYKKALRIGREHVGALVNTLALAYAGAALPLILLVYYSGFSGMIVNQEVFATEIIRTIVGSIGLILAVPITTIIAVFMLVRPKSH